MKITSLDNKKIKYLMKLKNKKFRDQENKFIIETPNLIAEALKCQLLEEVYKLEDYSFNFPNSYDLSKEVMNKVSDLENSKILGICRKPLNPEGAKEKLLLLDGIQDPGNLGTIIRSALGFNVEAIILSEDSCDAFNSKVVRASEGAIFKVPIIRADLSLVIDKLKQENIPIISTDVRRGKDIRDFKCSKFALLMGSEGQGVKKIYQSQADVTVYIKTNQALESLNVAVATSILLYELFND